MTPKEKAFKILAEYYFIISGIDLRNKPEWMNFWNSNDSYCVDAKRCALITVREIIEYSKDNEAIRDINGDPYWQEVEKIIIGKWIDT